MKIINFNFRIIAITLFVVFLGQIIITGVASAANPTPDWKSNWGTQIDNMDNAALWAASGTSNSSIELNNSCIEGTGSIFITRINGSNTTVRVRDINDIDMSAIPGDSLFGMYIYSFYDLKTWSSATDPTAYIELLTTTSGSKYFSKSLASFELRYGWNWISWRKDSMTANGGALWSDPIVKVTVGMTTKNTPSTYGFDDLRYNIRSIPTVIFTFDEAYMGAYDNGYTVLNSYGYNATWYIRTNVVGDHDTEGNIITLEMLKTMYLNGHDISVHGNGHSPMEILPDKGLSQAVTARNYLIANGMPRAAYHLAYPGGSFDEQVVSVVKAAGFATARENTWNDRKLYSPTVGDTLYKIRSGLFLTNTTTLATAKNYVNHSISNGTAIVIIGHNLVDGAPANNLEWNKDDFAALVEYVHQTGVPVLSMNEWYHGLTNTSKPIANFTATKTSIDYGPDPVTVKFYDNSSFMVTNYLWDFGDGVTSTEKDPQHDYNESGKYSVTLTTTNNGGTNSKTRTDVIDFTMLTANFTASVTSGQAPLSVVLDSSISTGLITQTLWNFGDGTTSTEANPTHTYTQGRKYTVSLTVSNDGGSNTLTRNGYVDVTEVYGETESDIVGIMISAGLLLLSFTVLVPTLLIVMSLMGFEIDMLAVATAVISIGMLDVIIILCMYIAGIVTQGL